MGLPVSFVIAIRADQRPSWKVRLVAEYDTCSWLATSCQPSWNVRSMSGARASRAAPQPAAATAKRRGRIHRPGARPQS
jgi:hypothetical protein